MPGATARRGCRAGGERGGSDGGGGQLHPPSGRRRSTARPDSGTAHEEAAVDSAVDPALDPAADAGPSRPAVSPPPMAPAPPPREDALNLGTTVLPILLKTYWKQGVVALVVLAVVIWLLVG